MALVVKDVERIDEQIRELGSGSAGSTEGLLSDLEAWFRDEGSPRGVLDDHAFSYLCEAIRSPADEDSRCYAIGVLASAKQSLTEAADKAQFVVRYGMRQLATRTKRPVRWSEVVIPEADGARAWRLFEDSIGASEREDAELIAAVDDFVAAYGQSFDFFGRFGQDLSALAEILGDPSAKSRDREVARAALSYFVEVSDAIPDDLGHVGLLDDAFVVCKALETLRPERVLLSSFLDGVVERWPFLSDFVLSEGGHRRPLSEYSLANAALLLASIDESKNRSAVVIGPEAGPMPFLAGFVRALALVRQSVAVGEPVLFAPGERLTSRDPKAPEVEFVGYGIYDARGGWTELPPDQATHFRVLRPGKKGGSTISQAHDIRDLSAFRRSSNTKRMRSSGTLSFDRTSARIGTLERLFGLLEPIHLPAEVAPVIVVAPIAETEALARDLELLGMPLFEVLPMGKARVDGDRLVTVRWTKDGPGAQPYLLVVKSFSDAVEIWSEVGACTAVIGEMRRDGGDLGHVRFLAQQGVQVLAFANKAEREEIATLSRLPCKFWSWEPHWISALRWPPNEKQSSASLLSDYENRVKASAECRVSVGVLEQDDLATAYELYRALEGYGKDDEDETLQGAIQCAFGCLWELLGSLDEELLEASRYLAELAGIIDRSERWWAREVSECAKRTLDALAQAAESLRASNPKAAALREWASENARGFVVAKRGAANPARERLGSITETTWVTQSGRVDFGSSTILAGWFGRRTMARWLRPPRSIRTKLLLYPPEVEWYEAFERRHERTAAEVRRVVAKRPSIPVPARSASARSISESRDERSDFDVDEVLERARRHRALARLRSGESELASARLVHFAGGSWAAFSPTRRVDVVVGERADGDDEAFLRRTLIADLETGDQVLMVRGSDRDAVRHAADAELAPGLRDKSAIWKRALRHYAEGNKVSQIAKALERAGCSRTQQTVRLWLTDDGLIGPHEAAEDVLSAIVKVTGDSELAEHLEDCRTAIGVVRQKHHEVGRRLARRVLERASTMLRSDTELADVVELEDRLVLLTVDSVDRELVEVPHHRLNTLEDS